MLIEGNKPELPTVVERNDRKEREAPCREQGGIYAGTVALDTPAALLMNPCMGARASVVAVRACGLRSGNFALQL